MAQLQPGGVAQLSPRDLAVWIESLQTLTIALRFKAQLILDNMCFCRRIENFGQFKPLENACFQPGEEVHVYVQVRNFASRSVKIGGYSTALKGKLEIYDEYNREKPFMCWHSELHTDYSCTLRQDYFVNFRFQVPPKCPPGSYTVFITVEDWTNAAPDANEVAKLRIARSSLDFRVGGPISRQPAPTSPMSHRCANGFYPGISNPSRKHERAKSRKRPFNVFFRVFILSCFRDGFIDQTASLAGEGS